MIREVLSWLEAFRATDGLPYAELVRAGCQRILENKSNSSPKPFVGVFLPDHDYNYELDRVHIGTLFRVASEWISGYDLRLVKDGDSEQKQAAWLITCLDRESARRASQHNKVVFVGAEPVPFSKEKQRIRFEVFREGADTDALDLNEIIWVPDWYKPNDVPSGANVISSAAWQSKHAAAIQSRGGSFATSMPDRTRIGTCEDLQRVWLGKSTKSRSDYWLNLGEELRPFHTINRIIGVDNSSYPSERPLISIVVPVYDREAELVRLAHSIRPSAACALETIFVLNGSPTGTRLAVDQAVEVIKSHGCGARAIDLGEKCGCATIPRDIGSYAANGDWILFLDSDDYLEPGFFARFPTETTANVLYPRKRFRNFGRDMGADFPWDQTVGATDAYDNNGFQEQLIKHTNFIGNSGAAVRRDAFVRCGGILHSLKYCEDYYLWLALASQGSAAHSHHGVVNVALHPGNNELAVGDSAWIEIARKRAVEVVSKRTEVYP